MTKSEVKYERIPNIIKNPKYPVEFFINDNYGELMDKKAQKELIELCGLRDRKGVLQKDIRVISGYLKDNYKLQVATVTIEVEGRRKKLWLICNIIDTIR